MRSTGQERQYARDVVVGFDGTAEACDALALGRLIAEASAAELIVAAVYPGRNGESNEPRREFFGRVFDRARYELGQSTFTRCEMIDSPARGLHDLAVSEGASLIVVGSTHRGRFGQVLPGSLGSQLLSGAPCPVAIAPRGFVDRPRLETVGVGYDEGPESERGLDYASRLAALLGAELRLITVGPRYGPLDLLFESSDAARDRLQVRLEHGLAQVPAEVTARGVVREGDPASELAAASQDLDLLVVGSRSFGPARSVLLGSVSADLFRTAASATLVIPRGFDVPIAFEGAPAPAASRVHAAAGS